MISQKFAIHGKPHGKGRPRVTARGGHARAYTPASTREWEADAVAQIIKQRVRGYGDAPIAVQIVAIYGKNPRIEVAVNEVFEGSVRAKRPDLDNIVKSVLDAMQAAGVVTDDKTVCVLHAEKLDGEP